MGVQRDQRLDIFIKLKRRWAIHAVAKHFFRLASKKLCGNNQPCFGQSDIPHPARIGFIKRIHQITKIVIIAAPHVRASEHPIGFDIRHMNGQNLIRSRAHFRLNAQLLHLVIAHLCAEAVQSAAIKSGGNPLRFIQLIRTDDALNIAGRAAFFLNDCEEVNRPKRSKPVFRPRIIPLHNANHRAGQAQHIPCNFEIHVAERCRALRRLVEKRRHGVDSQNLLQPFLTFSVRLFLHIIHTDDFGMFTKKQVAARRGNVSRNRHMDFLLTRPPPEGFRLGRLSQRLFCAAINSGIWRIIRASMRHQRRPRLFRRKHSRLLVHDSILPVYPTVARYPAYG